ncbi:MAG: hypothetical protein K8S27_07405 [Candidatus Omnitrophica bacterium]|nr:hypothetical protein [Candidatus Omnitrophota bacterium]
MKQGVKEFFLILITFLAFPVLANSSELSLNYLSGQTTFYANQEITLQWQPDRPMDWQNVNRLQARMIYANKTIFHQNLQPVFPLKLNVTYPELRPGVIADPVLVVIATLNDGTLEEVARHQFYFYASDLEFGALQFNHEIGVYDQTDDQTLIVFMDKMKIPYTPLMDMTEFNGAWIVCAGLDFDQGPSLFEELQDKFDQGISLLVLPPLTGRFPLPFYSKDSRMFFADSEIIKDFNKAWNLKTAKQERASALIGFLPSPGEDSVMMGQTSGNDGYDWFEYRKKSCAMIFLGWDLLSLSDSNPSAKFLFQYLLTEHDKNRGKK